MNPTDQWLKGTFCPDDGSGQEQSSMLAYCTSARPERLADVRQAHPLFRLRLFSGWRSSPKPATWPPPPTPLLPPAAQKAHPPRLPHARHPAPSRTADIQLFFNERRYLHHESQRKLRNILNMIFAAAEDDHLIDRNPTHSPRLKLTNAQKTVRETLSVDAMADIQDVLPKLEK